MVFIDKFKKLDSLFVLENNGHMDLYLRNTKIKPKSKGWVENIIHRIKMLIRPIKYLFVHKNNKLYKDIWLISQTINNEKALSPIYDSSKTYVNPRLDFIFLLFDKLLYIIPLFFYLLNRKKLRLFYKYFDLLGVSEKYKRALKRYKPKKIVFVNDHLPYHVALKKAANELKISTYYLQHACVGKSMPPLDFTVSFLDGQDAYDKYKYIGEINGKVELIGAIRFNELDFNINNNKNVKNIGIALNAYDDIKDAIVLLDHLFSNFPKIKLIIRMHPGDDREFIYNKNKIYFSDSKKEDVLSFLSNIDMLVAGDSSIHLEATMCNVVPVYYKISKNEIFDIYEFVKNGLVFYAKDSETLINYLKSQVEKKENVLERVNYYDEFYRTEVNYKIILKEHGLL